jgi:hypothetical protein
MWECPLEVLATWHKMFQGDDSSEPSMPTGQDFSLFASTYTQDEVFTMVPTDFI